MPVTALPSQAVLIDQVAMLTERCAAFQTAHEKSARENARLLVDLLHRDHLLSDCVGPLELLRRLASLPPCGESLPEHTAVSCEQLLVRISNAQSDRPRQEAEDWLNMPDVGRERF